MNLSINKRLIEIKLEEDTTVLDLINAQYLESKEKVVTEVILDGEKFFLDDENNFANTLVKDIGDIDLSVKTSMELANEALDSCNSYIDTVIASIDQLTASYQQGDQQLANAQFAEAIEIFDLFVQLITGIHKTFKRNVVNLSEQTPIVQKLEIHLFSIIKALLPAKEKEDIIMLCDLLEYELKDNLTQWKIQAIPALKKLSQY
ncbi:hypothetical protein OAT67_00480 [Bacteriovoracaceae bacterium]|nr:hypothetical protein [Bacteriovoracaceae bacterium]